MGRLRAMRTESSCKKFSGNRRAQSDQKKLTKAKEKNSKVL